MVSVFAEDARGCWRALLRGVLADDDSAVLAAGALAVVMPEGVGGVVAVWVVVVGLGVVGTATFHVGDGGTRMPVDGAARAAELRSDRRAGGCTVEVVSANAPPSAPMVSPTAPATPAIATADTAMTLSRM
ncbi:hypothetical protein BJI47_05425 [Rhodococcus sp. 1168]|nr:hypothetical protein BJI47_05425 [Rhodococcus sp. 1168]